MLSYQGEEGSKELFHITQLDYQAVDALREVVEDYMDKFHIEFRVGVEAERQKDLKEEIIRKYGDIRELKACYYTMEREDEDGDFDFILPLGSDWKSMAEQMETDYKFLIDYMSKFFALLMRFLRNVGPNSLGEEHVMCSDMIHISDSYNLLDHLVSLSREDPRRS